MNPIVIGFHEPLVLFTVAGVIPLLENTGIALCYLDDFQRAMYRVRYGKMWYSVSPNTQSNNNSSMKSMINHDPQVRANTRNVTMSSDCSDK